MVISWPGHINDPGGIRHQFHHVIDIVPTILKAAGIQAQDTLDGIKQKPIEGVGMVYTFDKANANAPSKRQTQYFEIFANSGIYHDGWYACTTPPEPPWLFGKAKMPDVMDYKWELYNIAEDFSQHNDLATKYPDKLKEMQALFVEEANKNQVLPQDNSVLPRLLTARPSGTAGHTTFTYQLENVGVPVANAPTLLNRDYTITAEITVPKDGAEGMIANHGRALRRVRPVPAQRQAGLRLQPAQPEAVPLGRRRRRQRLAGAFPQAGKHTIVFDFKYDGPGFGKSGTGVSFPLMAECWRSRKWSTPSPS